MATGKQNKGMVDISDKPVTRRTALASGFIRMNHEAWKILTTKGSPKGNVLETARVAGILAVKKTPEMIPMCHPLEIKKVKMDLDYDKKRKGVLVTSEVVSLGQTGVEMEALTAVSVACLTIYDMMKFADKAMVISEIALIKKTGGKSGDYYRK
jgi:cyclic pyranopterin phosphate synthase